LLGSKLGIPSIKKGIFISKVPILIFQILQAPSFPAEQTHGSEGCSDRAEIGEEWSFNSKTRVAVHPGTTTVVFLSVLFFFSPGVAVSGAGGREGEAEEVIQVRTVQSSPAVTTIPKEVIKTVFKEGGSFSLKSAWK
jgi:hypothetical protein